jgi:hypothetical protein
MPARSQLNDIEPAPTRQALKDEARELVHSFGYLTDPEFQLLTGTAPATTETWRREGRGPAWARIGNVVVYPRAAVQEFIESQLREPAAHSARRSL